MRISDWSSDVCSSDLVPNPLQHLRLIGRAFHGLQDRGGGMLEWNVQIRCNQPFGHQGNDVIHMRIRIDIVQANPRAEASQFARKVGHMRSEEPSWRERGCQNV